jgi:hypothetical protein
VTIAKWTAVDEITALIRALADPHSVAAQAALIGEVYVDYTTLCGGEPSPLECRP